MNAWSYQPGDWYAVFGPHVAVALPPGARSRVAALWEVVDAGAELGETLDALLAEGLRDLPDLALVADSDDGTTAIVRGAGRVHLAVDGEVVHVTAEGATTWVERSVQGVTWVRIDTGAAAVGDDAPGELTSGLVRIGSAECLLRDAEPRADHDGLTHTSDPEATGLMPPLPGIPGQPPAPPVTARPVARLLFSSGEDVAVDRAVLVGRDPQADRLATTDEPRLVAVPSPHQEVSSTHLEVRPGSGADHGSAVATDLGSTNGTLIQQPGLPIEPLRAGVTVQLIPGAVIDLGDGVTVQVVNA